MGLVAIKSAEGAEQYYYDKDPINGQESSVWYGKAAQDLGMQGQVTRQDFRNLLLGLDKGGNELLSRAGQAHKRAAYDLTFSAPKSVSMVALHAGDESLRKAHEQAVKDALDLYELHFCQFRKTEEGKTRLEQSDNIATAMFHHTTSRATATNPIPDPQLHSHAVTMNMTHTVEGWRAIRNDALFANQNILLGEYRAKLAQYVRQAGYEITFTKKGHWELAGVKQEWIEQFSKRSQEIQFHYDQLKTRFPGMEEAELKAAIAREVRLPKNYELAAEDLQAGWEAQLPKAELKQALQRETGVAITRIQAEQAMQKAVQAWHEKEATFTPQQLFPLAYQFGQGQLAYQDLATEFARLQNAGELVLLQTKINAQGFPQEQFTSRQMLETEQAIVAALRQGQGQVAPLLPQVPKELCQGLSEGQAAAVKAILTTQDRFLLIQGDAGTGKTTAIRRVQEALQKTPEVNLLGLGFTGQAAKELKQAAGLETATITRFLGQEPQVGGERVYIIDEASMISSQQFAELVAQVEQAEARAVFMGDGKQLAAIGAGKMFKELQELECCQQVKLEQVFRQLTPQLQEAVAKVKDFQEDRNPQGVEQAFALLRAQGAVHFAPDRETRMQFLVQDYCSHQDLRQVCLLTARNEDRHALNQSIRTELQAQGRVSSEEQELVTRHPHNLTAADKAFAANYQVGDYVFAKANLAGVQGMSAGKEYQIIAADCQSNRLTLQGPQTSLEVDLLTEGEKLSGYAEIAQSFAPSDRVVFLKNDRRLDVENGLTGQIEQITGANLWVRLDNGDQRQFSSEDYRYLDLAYCTTLHKAQGQTVDEVMLAVDSENSLLNKTESLYVALTRARFAAQVYGDQASTLIRQFEQGQEKTSTLGYEEFELEVPGHKSLGNVYGNQEVALIRQFEQGQEKTSTLGYEIQRDQILGQKYPIHGNEPSTLDQVLREHLVGLQLAEQSPFPAGLEQNQAPDPTMNGSAELAHSGPEISLEL